MGVFCKQFDEAVLEIVTDCRVFEPIELNAGKKHPEGVWVECALWDTGSTNTLISSRVVEELHLVKSGQAPVTGLSGDELRDTYHVHLVLPDGSVFVNVEVLEDTASDYDVIIGMDVMRGCDVAITYPEGKTKFTYERPSKRNLDFTK